MPNTSATHTPRERRSRWKIYRIENCKLNLQINFYLSLRLECRVLFDASYSLQQSQVHTHSHTIQYPLHTHSLARWNAIQTNAHPSIQFETLGHYSVAYSILFDSSWVRFVLFSLLSLCLSCTHSFIHYTLRRSSFFTAISRHWILCAIQLQKTWTFFLILRFCSGKKKKKCYYSFTSILVSSSSSWSKSLHRVVVVHNSQVWISQVVFTHKLTHNS